MKKSLFFLVLMAFAVMSANADDLKQGDKLIKSLELDFDEQAKTDDVFISWELSGDWDKFDYCFSQGILEDNVFTIRATEYKGFANGHEGIALTLEGKSKTDEGNYNLSMHVKDVKDDLDFPKDALNADFQINYILPPPPPLWKRILLPCIILLVLALIIWFVLDTTAKFPKGLLQLGNNTIKLKGKKTISVKDELKKMSVSLADGTDVVIYKKRFTSFQGPCIKEIKNCGLQCNGINLSKGKIMRRQQDVKGLKDINGKEIIIRYC